MHTLHTAAVHALTPLDRCACSNTLVLQCRSTLRGAERSAVALKTMTGLVHTTDSHTAADFWTERPSSSYRYVNRHPVH